MKAEPSTDPSSARRPIDPIELARSNWVLNGWGSAASGMALITALMRVQQLYISDIERRLRPFGLTFARFEVLRLLAFTKRGELPVGKIGERLQVHPASVTNAVQRLEDAGLVRRSTHPDDRRSVLAHITDSGRTAVEACTELLNETVFSAVALKPEEIEQALRLIGELRMQLGDPGRPSE
jgi:DNA-binding MarR family transcriptional regulator